MPAYLIAIRREPVRDPDAMEDYRRLSREVAGGFSLIPRVVYGAVDALEGPAPDGVVMVEFPTVEEARAWYDSEGYQAAIPHRQRAADYQVFIVEGMSG